MNIIMSVHNLEKLFKPASIAVIGASEQGGSVGWGIMRNILDGQFPGRIYPVNPKHATLWNLTAYHSLLDLPEPVDLAVIAVPIATVPGIIRQSAGVGIGGAIIISAGGKETGLKGFQLEETILSEAKDSSLRIIGPNCLGVISSQARLNASFVAQMPLPGKMAFISQSGAIGAVILDLAIKERIGFSYFISLGSMMDVDFGDVIDYLGGDPNVSSIVMYVENLNKIRNFMSAARAVSRIKPLVVLKAGRTRAGARAAASHTGALAGEDAVYDAAFKRAGIVRVKTFEELFDCAELLAKQSKPAGPGLAIITNAGGPGVMAADALSDYGLEPVKLSDATINRLNTILSAHWSRANPIDMVGDSSTTEFLKAVEVCADAPEIDGLMVMLAPQAMIDPADVARSLVKFLKEKPFPVITSWMGGPRVEKAREIFNEAGIPTFDTAERAVRAFKNLIHYTRNIELIQEIPSKLPRKLDFDHHTAQVLIGEGVERNKPLLTEVESKALLKAYGIPINPTEKASTVETAVSTADKLGYPVTMKILSRDITHKSDADGVRLNLKDADAVRETFQAVTKNAHIYHPDSIVDGVTIQPMIVDVNYELILGAKTDRDFGPILLFGTGGIMAEIFKDRALALPPLNRLLARRLMEDTKIYRLLQGYRNHPQADMALLEEILIRLSQLVIDFPEIEELDINPLIVTKGDVCAVDARVLLRTPHRLSPHHLVISPYPGRYETRVVTNGLVNIFIRPIRPEDAALMQELFQALSTRSVYYRFFTPLKQLPHHMLARFTQIDYDREIALVAVYESEIGEKMLGVARIILEWNQKDAELSVLVGDPWQGKGIGAELLKRCLSIAKERGYVKIHGTVLAENIYMLKLGHKMGFTIKKVPDTAEYDLSMDLQTATLSDAGLWSPN
jgi:acetyltransferase